MITYTYWVVIIITVFLFNLHYIYMAVFEDIFAWAYSDLYNLLFAIRTLIGLVV
jgi:hypothetical protein